MIFPLRKCYQTLKISVVLILVVSILVLFEQWRGGKRSARAILMDPLEVEYEKQILEDEARIVPGLGENGAAAYLVGEEKKLGEESEKKLAINVYLSDRIAYNRTLRDVRNPACSRVVYDAELPSASVILIFHNEPYSVVIRTIWSVLNSARRDQPWYKHANFVDRQSGRMMKLGYPGQDSSSPFVYLKEIILVDDNSTLPELKGKLSHYVRTRLPPGLIRILRLPDRVGLTRARLAGARYAAGAVLVLLDAHCEAQRDWLRPLLAAIKARPHAVAVPIIDVIESSNFFYSTLDRNMFQVGGFTFAGHFTWVDVPEREKLRRGSDIAPTWSPTMAGGLFAISRAYFWELGAYDEQMDGWGGENLEMSFRIWQCGGTLETVPCSRVGHVFRSFHPYGMPAHSDTHGINTARMAEVWMDEYAELFYLHRPDLRNNPKIGDVTHRKVLREKLQCKSFQWYLDTVYKEKFVPVRDVYGYGRFRNAESQLCVDTLQREHEGAALGAYPCHAQLQATQYFSLSRAGELRDEFNCAHVLYSRSPDDTSAAETNRKVVLTPCRGKGREQKWERLPTGQLRHARSRLCLQAPPRAGDDLRAARCAARPAQRWDIDYTEDNDFHLPGNGPINPEQEERLSKIRGRKRISRSLLSVDEQPAAEAGSSGARARARGRRGRHHKRRGSRHGRTKNKFIVKLLRTLMNGTEDHLELDIHCRHRQLYPNNSFVRDLVTILNDKNIKVVNNGRVFERHRVTELRPGRAPNVLHKLDIAASAPASDTLMKQRTKKPEPASEPEPEPEPRQAVQARGPDALRGAPSPQPPPTDRDRKIIIEDFVEIKPLTTSASPRVTRKRKHKRVRPVARAPPAPERAPPAADSAPSGPAPADDRSAGRGSGAADASAEDAPLRDESLAPPDASDGWLAGAGGARYRRNDTLRRGPGGPARSAEAEGAVGRARLDASADDAENEVAPPVKVLVRSNLTFNMGDEFFDWQRGADDVQHILSQLEIPANSSRAPAVQAWLRLRPPPRPAPASEDSSSDSNDSSE